MKIALIVAMASNRAIGLNNQLPWHLSVDLKRFKKITLGSPILMGRRTYESIGRPLPGRTNIILTRNPAYRQDGCLVFNEVEKVLKHCCQNAETLFVIGGSALYEAVLPIADTLYVTEIKKEFPGDAFFPEINKADWLEVEREDIDDDPNAAFSYSFLKFKKTCNAADRHG